MEVLVSSNYVPVILLCLHKIVVFLLSLGQKSIGTSSRPAKVRRRGMVCTHSTLWRCRRHLWDYIECYVVDLIEDI